MRTRARLFALLAASITLAAWADSAPGPARPATSNSFLFGCEWPYNASQQVKDLFWETGCNYVRITGGGYGWATESHKKALLELQARGVKAMVQLGSHYPSADYFALKDSYFVDQSGGTGKEDRNAWAITYDGQAWPQYSYAGEPFRRKLEQDFAVYLGALKPCRNIAGLLLHNEPGYFWVEGKVYDYNPYAIARFRQWLARQHGDIRDLNLRWGTAYRSYDAVEPPRDLPPVANIAAWMDWRRFNIALIQDFLRWERGFARRLRPDLPATTNLSGPLDNWFPLRLGDPYALSQPFDLAGIDIYPAEWSSRWFPGFAMDMALGVGQGRRAEVLECDVYSGEKWPGLSAERRAELLQSTVWSYIGHGASGILLWTLSGQQGFALTRGEFNRSVGAVREIAHTAQMLRLGGFRKPARKVAICVDQDAYLYYGGTRPRLEGGSAVQQSVEALYASLAARNLEADIVCADQVRKGAWRRYRALLLATPVTMDGSLAGELRRFVAAGGLVVAEAPFAEHDRWGGRLPTWPGLGLDKVFGLQARAPGEGTPGGWTVGGPSRRVVSLAGAHPLAKFADGTPSVTISRFGKGTAVYAALDLGLACAQAPRGELAGLLHRLLRERAGQAPAISVSDAGSAFLDCGTLADGRGNRLVIVANPPDHARPLTPVAGAWLTADVGGSPARVHAYAFPPARTQGGRTIAGPERLTGTSSGSRRIVRLPVVTAAVPVLFARDAAPLLTIDAPVAAKPGSPVTVRVTCFNPSPRTVRGSVQLVLPAGWKASGKPAPVVIRAGGEQSVLLKAKAASAAGRGVVKARMDHRSGSTPSVPVDMSVAAGRDP